MSKRFTVTLPDSVFKELEVLADAQGRPTANLASFLIEVGVSQMKERRDSPPESITSPNTKKDDES
ncbi:MAG: hypothetical protein AAF378_04005 [Cyanobacteria bacterium P01_A01_bin.84]